MKINRLIGIFLMILVVLFSWPLLRKSDYNLSRKNLISEDKVDKIVIKSKDNRIVVQEDKRWFITEPIKYLGDYKKIDNLLNVLKKTKIENIVTDNIEFFDRFDVDDKKGIFVSIYKDNYLIKEIIIGKMDSNFSRSYVRIGREVYLVDSNISHIFHVKADDLRSRKIFNLEEDQITSIKIEKDNELQNIVRKGNRFYLNNEEYKNIEIFIDKILNLQVHKFKKKEEVVKTLYEHYMTLEVKENNNQVHRLIIFKNEGLYKSSKYNSLDNELYFTILNSNLKQIQEFKFK